MPFLLALDEGTSSARAAIYNTAGQRVAMKAVAFACQYPQPGWVEQDALAIWSAQLDAARQCLASANITANEITAIGITNQRETTVVWDRATGQPLAPAIVWQCRRTAEWCRQLAASPQAALVEKRSGLVIDAYFSGSKIRWLLDHIPDGQQRAEAGELCFGNIDTWLIWKLSGGKAHVTDPTNASRTMLMKLSADEWDDDLLRIFNVPRAMLPKIVPSSGVCAEADAEWLGHAIPIAGIAGDQQAALFGQACFREGLTKNTYGTGCFALFHTGNATPVSANRLLSTRAASQNASRQYAVEGSVFVAGAAVQWLRDSLGLIRSAAESETVAASTPDTGGVYVVPAFTGLGAPHWRGEARGIISGLTRGTGASQIVRATLESIAYQTRELIDAMQQDAGQTLNELRVDGGAAQNDFLMQFQADILNCPVVRPQDVETTALGAAYLAGLATGFFSGTDQIESFWSVEKRFEPAMPASRREVLFAGWKSAVARA
jgi:glycerol kinase